MMDVFGPETKVGDEVCIVTAGYRPANYRIRKGVIECLTQTQVTAIDGRRFLRRTGKEIGYSYGWGFYLEPLTPEIQKNADHAEIMRDAESVCAQASVILGRARGDEAIRLASLLPAEFKALLEKNERTGG